MKLNKASLVFFTVLISAFSTISASAQIVSKRAISPIVEITNMFEGCEPIKLYKALPKEYCGITVDLKYNKLLGHTNKPRTIKSNKPISRLTQEYCETFAREKKLKVGKNRTEFENINISTKASSIVQLTGKGKYECTTFYSVNTDPSTGEPSFEDNKTAYFSFQIIKKTDN